MRGQDFFERGLHAGGEIVVALLERLVRLCAPGRGAFRDTSKTGGRCTGVLVGVAPAHVRALALMREIFEAEPEGKRRCRTRTMRRNSSRNSGSP